MDRTALKTELITDPAALGYAPYVTAKNAAALCALLNFARDGVTACPVNGVGGAAITIRRADISFVDFWNAISVADMTALPTNPTATQLSNERRYLAWLSGLAGLSALRLQNDDGSDTEIVANIKAIFSAGSGTLTRLNALATRSGSRAQQLFGVNAVVIYDDITLTMGW